jgi:dihydropteroate synthase
MRPYRSRDGFRRRVLHRLSDVLTLGAREFGDGAVAIMAIVNRTPDSFYDRGATFGLDAALARVDEVVAQGAEIVDLGAVRAGPGAEVNVAQEIDRIVPLVAAARATHPQLVISVDTWRHEVGDAVCTAGADLINDAWAGHDPLLAQVAADRGAGLVCSHTGGLPPRTRPHRVHYDDVMRDVIRHTVGLAEHAVALGVDPRRILIDPAHDFGKNTYHSLEITRRLDEMVATGWPVLVSLSNKDFVGETLDVPVEQRLLGTLATTAVCAWQGAAVFRAHNVPETRQVLDMVASIRGLRPPARPVRGLA